MTNNLFSVVFAHKNHNLNNNRIQVQRIRGEPEYEVSSGLLFPAFQLSKTRCLDIFHSFYSFTCHIFLLQLLVLPLLLKFRFPFSFLQLIQIPFPLGPFTYERNLLQISYILAWANEQITIHEN